MKNIRKRKDKKMEKIKENKKLSVMFVLIVCIAVLFGFVVASIGKQSNITQTQTVQVDLKGQDDKAKLNINKATKEELMRLPSVGENTANNIINYRKSNIFSDVYDLLNVKGVGETTFNNIKNRIKVVD